MHDDQQPDRGPDSLPLDTGAQVAVRSRFDGTWADGYEVIDSGADGFGPFQVRRRCDAVVLPAEFAADEIRSAELSDTTAWAT